MSSISGKSFQVGRANRRGDEQGGPPLLRLELSVRGVVVLFLVVATAWALIQLWSVVILVVISTMLAAALIPFVDWLIGRGLSRGKAVAIVSLLLVAFIAGILLLVVPAVVSEAQSFSNHLPQLKRDVADLLRRRGQAQMASDVERLQLSDILQRDQVVNYSRQVLGVLLSTLTVIVLTIYILIDARRIERFFFFALPDRYHEHVTNLTPALRTTVGGYIRGQLVTSACISVYTFVVLFALGVDNALGLAVLAGIADVIPLIGAFIAIIPGTLSAFNISVSTALIVFVALLLYQPFEDRVLTPRVYGSTLRLPTIAVFLAVIIGAKLMGVVGAVLALPAAAAIRVFIMYGHAVGQGRIEPVAPDDELLAPDEATPSPATGP